MSIRQPYKAYQKNAITTASSGELTLMLYNGCIKFMKRAQKEIAEKNYINKNEYIQRARSIIKELMITLDQNVDLSKQLLPLYEYINYLLREANIRNEEKSLKEALELVTDLRDTWKEVILKTRQKQYSKGSSV